MTLEPEIKQEVTNGVALMTLNRPSKLNAINLTMLHSMWNILNDWASDPVIKCVIICGSGGKAFSAGGDVLDVVHNRGNQAFMDEVYRAEYVVDRLIHRYPKPFIPILDGIVMGGGAGVSIHAHGRRIVTDKTIFAMPETALGLFPDVGASHFLNRMPGSLGIYIGLTGRRLSAADMIHAGIADYFMKSESIPEFVSCIKSGLDLDKVIRSFSHPSGTSELQIDSNIVNTFFNSDSLGEIIDKLSSSSSDWAMKTLQLVRSMCPFSQVLTFENIKRARPLDLEDCLITDFRLAIRLMERDDYFEGARALLIDRDRKPNWFPCSIEGVDKREIDDCFNPIVDGDLSFEDYSPRQI